VYLHLLDSPEDIDGLGHLSAKDRKKERERIKKRKAKLAEAAQQAKAEDGVDGEAAALVPKPEAQPKYAEIEEGIADGFLTRNFLTECESWCALLLPVARLLEPDLLTLVGEVCMRKQRVVQLVRVLVCGLSRWPRHPGLSLLLTRLARRLRGQDNGPRPVLREPTATLVREQVDRLTGAPDSQGFLAAYEEETRPWGSLPNTLGRARLLLLASAAKALPAAKQTAAEMVADPAGLEGRGASVETLVEVLKVSDYSTR
jgi:hypothetical protein